MANLSSALLIAGFICMMVVQSLDALNADVYKLSGKRKPLVTREDPTALEDYKRTKRQLPQPLQEFQDFITTSKTECAKEMNINPNELQKALLYEDQPTPKEKCMMECILKRMEVMNQDDTLSTSAVGRIADIIGDNNALITSIAMASAENCKKFITAENSCERAYQINKCIANEMKMRKIKLIY
uniref:Odorant-binding protein n=1 Tax=Zeugodacus tau TaxID=137263 RepID=A0A6M9U0M0_ZEUTA|nr:odorant-binding protein [Zeugodacus tau]